MAITHFTPQLISRADGRSAVLSAAYRHCAKMTFEAEGRTVDYTAKRGMVHEEVLLPADAPQWARTMVAERSVAGVSEAFWNKVEAFEKRSDAQLAKEYIIALPIELTTAQNIALMRQFVAEHILPAGMVADWVYHDDPGNPHVHLMTSLRPLTEDGFGPKRVAVLDVDGTPLRNRAGKIIYTLWAGDKDAFLAARQGWIDLQNHHLALAGLDVRVDGRSYAERGIDIVPTTHVGVAATAIERKARRQGCGSNLDRLRLFEEQQKVSATRILRRPEIVLDIVSREKSVFDERDVAKVLHRYVDDAAAFGVLMARILQSPDATRFHEVVESLINKLNGCHSSTIPCLVAVGRRYSINSLGPWAMSLAMHPRACLRSNWREIRVILVSRPFNWLLPAISVEFLNAATRLGLLCCHTKNSCNCIADLTEIAHRLRARTS